MKPLELGDPRSRIYCVGFERDIDDLAAYMDLHKDNNRPIYKVFPEFRCPSGTSRSTRRADIMVAETVSQQKYLDCVTLHGIEIKVSVNDLLEDHKMAEYTDFCDYFWLAIPNAQEMIDAAESIRLAEWGLIVVDDNGGVQVIHQPKKLKAPFREITLANCVIKLA